LARAALGDSRPACAHRSRPRVGGNRNGEPQARDGSAQRGGRRLLSVRMQPAPKKSAAVPLVLMGAAAGVVALPALFGGTDVQRNRYATREACIADYSDAQCQDDVPVGTSRSVGATHYYYG